MLLLLVDDRGRVNLSHVTRKWARRYLVQEHPDGTLVLTPAITITQGQLEEIQGKQARG